MNTLAIGNPHSVHDMKWISWLAKSRKVYLLVRPCHSSMSEDSIAQLDSQNINYLGVIPDYSLRKYYDIWKFKQKISDILNINEIQFFHIFYAEPNALWINVFAERGLKTIITTRGSDILKAIPSFENKSFYLKFIYQLYKRNFRKADLITCTSFAQKKMILKLFAVSNAEVVRTGVDVDIMFTKRKRLTKILGSNDYFFFPRYMAPIYDHEQAIEAINLLPTSLLDKVNFVFVDKDSKSIEYVNKIRRKMDISKANYIFLAKLDIDDMLSLYQHALATVMTPISDGTPVSAIESIFCETPVIMPNLDYDNEIFDSGVVFYDKNSAISLSKRLESFILHEIELDMAVAISKIGMYVNRSIQMKKLDNLYQNITDR